MRSIYFDHLPHFVLIPTPPKINLATLENAKLQFCESQIGIFHDLMRWQVKLWGCSVYLGLRNAAVLLENFLMRQNLQFKRSDIVSCGVLNAQRYELTAGF